MERHNQNEHYGYVESPSRTAYCHNTTNKSVQLPVVNGFVGEAGRTSPSSTKSIIGGFPSSPRVSWGNMETLPFIPIVPHRGSKKNQAITFLEVESKTMCRSQPTIRFPHMTSSCQTPLKPPK